VHNLLDMRITTLILIFFYSSTYGQRVSGVYEDQNGYTLTLNKDSTFSFDYEFKRGTVICQDWATGRWTASGRIVNLTFIDVYDTMSQPNKPDSLAISFDKKRDKYEGTYELNPLSSGGQHKERFNNKFYKKGERLYFVDQNGRIDRSRRKEILSKKK
jgi:hypothetical protein